MYHNKITQCEETGLEVVRAAHNFLGYSSDLQVTAREPEYFVPTNAERESLRSKVSRLVFVDAQLQSFTYLGDFNIDKSADLEWEAAKSFLGSQDLRGHFVQICPHEHKLSEISTLAARVFNAHDFIEKDYPNFDEFLFNVREQIWNVIHHVDVF